MEEIMKLTGGARIGWNYISYPFATLTISSEYVKLDVSSIRDFKFQPKDIISIEPYRELRQGIKINHRVPGYNPKVIFWTAKEPEALIQEIIPFV